MANTPRVGIVVINWNGARDTLECLSSLKKVTGVDYHIYLVDNGSTPADRSQLQPEISNVSFIQNEKNLGFAGGNNVALKSILLLPTPPEYILLLNNDTIVDPAFLQIMLRLAESQPEIGIVSPKVYLFHQQNVFQTATLHINPKTGRIENPAEGLTDQGQFDQVAPAEAANGACLLIKTSVVKKIGLLDEAFFAYWEDADWCQRAREAGYTIAYCPTAKIWHKHSASTKGQRSIPTYYSVRNRYYFFRKHPAAGPGMARLVWEDVKNLWQIRTAGIVLKGIIDGLSPRAKLGS